jgi:haloalkane dehalogenase
VSHAEAKLSLPVVDDNLTIEQKVVSINNSTMAYLEQGEGDVVLFLHGNPTSSYLWRNVIPFVAKTHRAIAPDLIGMGQSGKPDIEYSYQEHYDYLSAFIVELGLTDITLAVHDWGAGLGFDYARSNPSKIKRIAFMEGVLPPIFPQPSFEAMGEEMGGMFKALKDPVLGNQLVLEQNMFVEQVLPGFVNRTLTKQAMDYYREPFQKPDHRLPTLSWPRAIPIANEPVATVNVMNGIKQFMESTEIPMLLLYATPGVLVNDQVKDWYIANISQLQVNYIGQGFHFIQEDQPDAIGRSISDWLKTN